MTAPLPPTTNDLDIKYKQRLLRQTRKLSQIFGELPREDIAQPLLEGCSMPTVDSEVASKDHPQQRQQRIRFSRHSLIDPSSRSFRFPLNPRSPEANGMSPQALSSPRHALGRSSSMRPLPTHHSKSSLFDSAHLGLGRLPRARSTEFTQSEENTRHDHLSIVENKPTRSSSLRTINRKIRPKDRSRRRTVHDPDTSVFQSPSRRSNEISTPTHSQRKSVSLWNRRKSTKDDFAHQQRFTADQGREEDDDASVIDAHPPLTEAQRIQSIRRGRKLAQVFGAEPPIALYKVTSFEDESTSPTSITGERIKTYIALSTSDLPSIYSDCSSMHFSNSNISSISTSDPSPDSTIDPFQESEGDQKPALPEIIPQPSDDDPDSVPAHDPDDGATATFRRRRLQAAKLSRFFGIAYNDLTSPVTMATRRNQADERAALSEVGVRIQEPAERGWLGGYRRAGAQEADMNDVITLLRQMPRA